MLIYPQIASIDVSGPLDAFGLANFLTGRRLYRPITASIDGASVPVAGNFLRIEPTCSCEDLPEHIDLLLVAGGPGRIAASKDPKILEWLRKLEPRCVRMGAICTGSSILLASGVTNGHSVATHWLEAMRLDMDPSTRGQVDPDAIFVSSGKFWTSAGMLAGIDLALALIEADHGRPLALDIARFMVLALRRNGGQSQFSAQLMADATEDPRVRKVQLYIWENPDADLSPGPLAARAAMSERSLCRRFKDVTNTTISRYIEDVRLSKARQFLETTDLSIQTVASRTGFGTATTVRRVFRRRLGVSPSRYRASFGTDRSMVGNTHGRDDEVRTDLENVIKGKSFW